MKGKLSWHNYVFLGLVFLLMCLLKWPYTLASIFLFGILHTTVTRKRKFCKSYCPLSTIQTMAAKEHYRPAPSKKYSFWILGLYSLAFFGLMAFYWTSPFLLWHRTLMVMLFSMITAYYLQVELGKKYWCTRICPLGHVLDMITRF